MLSHLVYVSHRNSKCTDAEIDNILEACKKNNSGLDITGVLLYSDKKFVQYLEGDQQKIVELYDKIKKDDRHSNAVMITLSPIEKRHFPSWEMGSKTFNEGEIALKTDLKLEDQKAFKEILAGSEKQGTRALELMKKFFN